MRTRKTRRNKVSKANQKILKIIEFEEKWIAKRYPTPESQKNPMYKVELNNLEHYKSLLERDKRSMSKYERKSYGAFI